MEKKQLKTYWIFALALVEFIVLKCCYWFGMRDKRLRSYLEVEDLIVLLTELIVFVSILYIVNRWKKAQGGEIVHIIELQMYFLLFVYILMEYLNFQSISFGERYLYIFYRPIPVDQIVYILVLLTPYMLFSISDLYENKEITDKNLYPINIIFMIPFIFLPIITYIWKSQLIWLVVYNISWIVFIKKKSSYTLMLSLLLLGADIFCLYHKFHVKDGLLNFTWGVEKNIPVNEVAAIEPTLRVIFTIFSLVFIFTQIYMLLDIDYKSKKLKKLIFILFFYINFLFVLEMLLKLDYIEMRFYRFSLINSNSGMFIYLMWLVYYLFNSKNIKKYIKKNTSNLT